MAPLVRRVANGMATVGVDTLRLARSVRGTPAYLRNRRELLRQFESSGKEFPFGKVYPCLSDRYDQSGSASGHYFHQDLYVAQRIFRRNPRRHVDVGSRVDGFVAHVASFREIEVFDIRPLTTTAANIRFRQIDLSSPSLDIGERTDSLSCLHTLEHFGLGRYGDPVNYYGYRNGLENLRAMLEPGGILYLSVPIGPQRIEFDAHRVFAVPYLLELFDKAFRVESFAYVNDAGDLVRDADPRGPEGANNFGCLYGCGIFELVKL